MSGSIQYHPDGVWEGLSPRQRDLFEEHYEEYQSWLQEEGKDPDRSIGYAPSSALVKLHRTTIFHRTVWTEIGQKIINLHPGHADWFVEALDDDRVRRQDGSRYKEGSKRKLVDAIRNDFEFRSRRSGVQRWEPDLKFSESNHRQADYFTLEEREDLFHASLRWEDLGKYSDLSPEERDRRKAYLAQKLKKPKEAVTPADFQRIRTSWKIPGLVSVAFDLGARPMLIQRCDLEWYVPEVGTFHISGTDSVKNNSSWEVQVSTRSERLLERWIEQRAALPQYDNTDALWLNREGNRYHSGPLNHLLQNLIDAAGIDPSGRRLTWTSIRRSTGTYLTWFESLAVAKEQLRHKSYEATLRYVEVPPEAGRSALDRLSGGGSDEEPFSNGSGSQSAALESMPPRTGSGRGQFGDGILPGGHK